MLFLCDHSNPLPALYPATARSRLHCCPSQAHRILAVSSKFNVLPSLPSYWPDLMALPAAQGEGCRHTTMDHGSSLLGEKQEMGTWTVCSPQHLPPSGIPILRVGVSLHKSQRHWCGWERTHSSNSSRSLQVNSICTWSCLSLTLRHRSAADFK